MAVAVDTVVATAAVKAVMATKGHGGEDEVNRCCGRGGKDVDGTALVVMMVRVASGEARLTLSKTADVS